MTGIHVCTYACNDSSPLFANLFEILRECILEGGGTSALFVGCVHLLKGKGGVQTMY